MKNVFVASIDDHQGIAAVDSADGRVLWKRSVAYDDEKIQCVGADRISRVTATREFIYVSVANTVHALVPKTGESAWNFKAHAESESRRGEKLQIENMRHRPLLSAGRLYVACGEDAYVLEAQTGKLIWERRADDEPHDVAWFLPFQGRAYLGLREGSVIALDGKGKEIWAEDASPEPFLPALFGKALYFGNNQGDLVFLDTKKRELVHLAGPGVGEDNEDYDEDDDEDGEGGDESGRWFGIITSEPVIHKDVLIVGSDSGHQYGMDIKRQATLWARKTRTSPLIANGLLWDTDYYGGSVNTYDPANGKTVDVIKLDDSDLAPTVVEVVDQVACVTSLGKNERRYVVRGVDVKRRSVIWNVEMDAKPLGAFQL